MADLKGCAERAAMALASLAEAMGGQGDGIEQEIVRDNLAGRALRAEKGRIELASARIALASTSERLVDANAKIERQRSNINAPLARIDQITSELTKVREQRDALLVACKMGCCEGHGGVWLLRRAAVLLEESQWGNYSHKLRAKADAEEAAIKLCEEA